MKSEHTKFLIRIILFCIIGFCACSYATSDKPEIQVQHFAQQMVERSIAPYVD